MDDWPCSSLHKTAYKGEPVFSHSKIVFTIGENTFKDKLGSAFTERANIHANIKPKDLEVFKEANNTAMFKGGATYADAITFGAPKVEKNYLTNSQKPKERRYFLSPDGILI